MMIWGIFSLCRLFTQSDKQGQKAVGERKCQSHENEGEGWGCVWREGTLFKECENKESLSGKPALERE